MRKATVVDHIEPRKLAPKLFWDENNWQPLCPSCHAGSTPASLDDLQHQRRQLSSSACPCQEEETWGKMMATVQKRGRVIDLWPKLDPIVDLTMPLC